MLEWIYSMMNAIASRRCQAAKAWEPTISEAIRSRDLQPQLVRVLKV